MGKERFVWNDKLMFMFAGTTTGWGTIPSIYHLPITLAVLAVTSYFTYGGFYIFRNVTIHIRKAIKDPDFRVPGLQK